MQPLKAVVVESNILTPFGMGVDNCWDALLENRTAVAPVQRFDTTAFFSNMGAVIPGLEYHGYKSVVIQMLEALFDGFSSKIPADAKLVLATTKGEIDLLEKYVITGAGNPSESSINNLLCKVIELAGTEGGGMALSAACTSSSAAAARAAAMIRNGSSDCMLVVACDSLTEFVYSGFSSLMALDKIPARPFDRDRAGLSVGEAAAFILVMSEERALREKRAVAGEIAGWGMSDDANHMTGPSRESEGLIRAINAALLSAGKEADDIDFISAHGTGTPYNDAMELGAFSSIFKERKLPTYSIKGSIGHTMGAAGLVEIAVALKAKREKVIPLTVNLKEPDAAAVGWVSDRNRMVSPDSVALITNAGFSGVNTALVLV